MKAQIRCPRRGHLLAEAETLGAHVFVTPLSVIVMDGTDQLRSQVTKQREPALRWPAERGLATLGCNCGEYRPPADLEQQLAERKRVIIGTAL